MFLFQRQLMAFHNTIERHFSVLHSSSSDYHKFSYKIQYEHYQIILQSYICVKSHIAYGFVCIEWEHLYMYPLNYNKISNYFNNMISELQLWNRSQPLTSTPNPNPLSLPPPTPLPSLFFFFLCLLASCYSLCYSQQHDCSTASPELSAKEKRRKGSRGAWWPLVN